METQRIQAQLAENLQAQQILGETSLKELREKVDEKLEQAVQPVTFSVPIVQQGYYLEAPQAPALDFLGGQPSAALYPVSWVHYTDW